jgi:hypothetical protein
LAYQAHLANEIWNASRVQWNRRGARRNCGRGARSADGRTLPATARHLALNGQVRPHYDPRSTLYNSDGQIFSDAGIPVVLLMENYDINRTGYHDSHDTMANIDLDYGVALAAIAIESVARAASQPLQGAMPAQDHLDIEVNSLASRDLRWARDCLDALAAKTGSVYQAPES